MHDQGLAGPPAPDAEVGLPPAYRLARMCAQDTSALHLRLRLASAVLFFMPQFCGNRLRTALYRACGVRIGPQSLVLGTMTLTGQGRVWRRLRIGAWCQVTTPLYADLNADVTIGDHVAVGHHVVLITTTHHMGVAAHRAGAPRCAPVRIGDGCWIGAGAMLLPGVTVGSGSVVAAGSVVTRDVPPNTLVGGVPARPIRALPED